MRISFKALASVAVLVIGTFLAYVLQSLMTFVACACLSVFLSKDRLLSLYNRYINSSNTSATNNNMTTNNKKNTPAKSVSSISSKRRDIGLELLNNRLATSGQAELLV
jgi:hypothetical protein